MRFLPQHKQTSEENHFWISISDLMTTLLFVFILILAVTILDLQTDYVSGDEYRKIKSENQTITQENIKLKTLLQEIESQLKLFKIELQTTNQEKDNLQKKYDDLVDKINKLLNKNRNARKELLNNLKQRLAIKGVTVDIVPEEGLMRISREKLFDTAKAEVKDKKLIEDLAKELLTLLEKTEYSQAINTIYIEGHTDADALNIHRGWMTWTNKELSAQRAINTFIVMKQYALKNNLQFKDQLFSYSGYAESRPIKGTNPNNKEDKARNRRIQFFFAINPPQNHLEDDIQ